MNKIQAKTLIKAVRTDLEMFECTEQGHYLERAKNSLDRLKKAVTDKEKIILDAKREIMLWS